MFDKSRLVLYFINLDLSIEFCILYFINLGLMEYSII